MSLAQTNNKSNNKPGINGGGDAVGKPTTTFHDFLGSNGQGKASGLKAAGGVPPPTEASASPTSDLGSERNTGSRVEEIPFYGSRGDVAGPESSSRFAGTKRNNSDSFRMSTRDKLQIESQDSPLWTKLLRYSEGGRPTRPHGEETLRAHQMRPVLASFMPQPSVGVRTDAHPSKWDTATAVNAGPVSQNAPHINQVVPFGYQVKDTNVGPSIVSQTAADEGSRTGIKGSGVLSLINATGAVPGRQPAGVLIRIGKQKSNVGVPESESSIAPSQRRTQSPGSQMTIFYRGQAHVFDNVHHTKAEAIMSLAGSNGGSWTTSYGSDSRVTRIPSSKNDAGVAAVREVRGRASARG